MRFAMFLCFPRALYKITIICPIHYPEPRCNFNTAITTRGCFFDASLFLPTWACKIQNKVTQRKIRWARWERMRINFTSHKSRVRKSLNSALCQDKVIALIASVWLFSFLFLETQIVQSAQERNGNKIKKKEGKKFSSRRDSNPLTSSFVNTRP